MSTDSSRNRVALALATILVVAGCADRRTPAWEGATPADEESVSVNVRSDHFNDVVVYAGRDGSWRRIGTVTGLGTARLDVPKGLGTTPGQFQLRVHAIGASDRTDYVTGVIRVDPGSVVELTVASTLRTSHWWLSGPS